MRNDVADQSVSVLWSHDFSVEFSGLGKVAVWMDLFVSSNKTLNWNVFNLGTQSHLEIRMSVWIVIRLRTLTSLLLRTISLTIMQSCSIRTVDLKLVIIGSESMSMSISVAEESSLKHFIKRRFDSRNHVGRAESTLLNFLKVILGISVQLENSDLDQRVVLMGPHFGHIEDIPFVILSILLRHDLNTEFPLWIIFSLNCFKKVFGGVIRILTLKLICLLSIEVLDPLHRLEVPLDPKTLSFSINPSVSMRPISIHMSVTKRSSSIREQNGQLMDTLWSPGQEVPKHVWILQVSLRVPLLGMNEIRELTRVPYKENRSVVSNHIPVSFFGKELNGKTSWIPFRVSRT